MISNPHPSLQAEKRDKRKQIPKSQGDYLNSARISFGLLFFFLSFLFCNMSALRWIMTQALNVDTPKLNNNLPYGALIHQETSWTVTRETNTCNTVTPLHLSHSTIAHLPFYFFCCLLYANCVRRTAQTAESCDCSSYCQNTVIH